MIRKEQNGIAWLEFELLASFKELQHGVFLRHGGVSNGHFSSLNFSYKSGDDKKCVDFNRQRIKDLFNLPTWARCYLTHGSQATIATSRNINELHYCDALATQENHLGLLITHADCQAAILFDPVERALATIHAGWRGNVLNIYAATIDFLKKHFGSQPENIFIGISPSLGPDDAEFVNYRKEFPPYFWDYQTKPNYFNLWEISRMQLQEKGVLPHHIQIAGISTLSNPEDFFSYRRNPASGRHGTLAALKPL